MGKYDSLNFYLKKLEPNRWRAEFSEIERILGFPLPASARLYPAWWANEANSHSHASAWLDAGWQTEELDLGSERVTFQRLDGRRIPRQRPPESSHKKTTNPDISTLLPWDSPQETSAKIGLSWKPIGRIGLSENKRLSFPIPPTTPGLYRFRIRNGKRETRYVGETENLQRRFKNYRTPGRTQKTSVRINNHLIKDLLAGAEISVSVAIDPVFATAGKTGKAITFSDKSVRRLFENFAQVVEGDSDIETLNR